MEQGKISDRKQTTLKKFLEFEKPEQYDFKCEMPKYYEDYKDNWKYSLQYDGMLKILQEEQDTFCMEGDAARRYQLYRILGGCGKDFDSDNSNGTCALAYEIYQNLWCVNDTKEDKKFRLSRLGFEGYWGGDTMNSFNTIYRDIMSRINEDTNAAKLVHKLRYEYTSAYTTLGNFVLVPYGFNRGRYRKTRDYWDKSLKYLCENGYTNKKTNGSFRKDDFKKYANVFFLWDYTKAADSKYTAEDLFDENKLETFLDNTIKRIKRRSIFMVAMLRIKQINENDFNEIMKYLSEPNTFFEDMDDALSKIRDLFKRYEGKNKPNTLSILTKAQEDIKLKEDSSKITQKEA